MRVAGFDPAILPTAVHWACILCREFSLGGAGGCAGAVALLGEVIPAAFAVAEIGDGNASPWADALGASAEAAELRTWSHYFELESEYASWEQIYLASIEDGIGAGGGDPGPHGSKQTFADDLAKETLPLLQSAVEFLKLGPTCPWLVVEQPDESITGPLPPAGEVAVVLGPPHGTDGGWSGEGSEAVLVGAGEAYASFSPADQETLAAALTEALSATAEAYGMSSLTFHAGSAPVDGSVNLPGLISVAIDCGDGEAEQKAAVSLITFALKGCLLQSPSAGAGSASSLGPFVATNVSASPSVSAALCRAI